MGSKQKQTQMSQKAHFEQRLEDRLSSLSKKGIESPRINKDTLVKKLRAKIRAINDRLKAIAANEKRTEELAKIKAERAAAPPKDRKKDKEKKAKEALEEGKAKKKKPEKTEMTQVPPKEQEDVKVEKTTEAPEGGKEKKKKKVKETAEAVGEGAAAPDQEKAKKKKKVKGETEEATDTARDEVKENE